MTETKHGRLVTLIDLTVDELAAIETALFAYKIETEMYLSGYSLRVVGHDECCDTARALAARRAEERVSLDERLVTINAILDRVSQK